MKMTQFGRDPGSWNAGMWNTGSDDDGSGNPGITLFGNALLVWAVCQDRDVSVDEAAESFNVDPGLIRMAVDDHGYMFVGHNDVIEQDGE